MSSRTELGSYPPSTPSEDSKWWSWQRAKRGAKIGAAVGVGFSGLVVGVSLLLGQTPEQINLLQTATNTAKGVLLYGSAGAVIDGFKPTSKLFSKYIETHVNTVKGVTSGISKVADKLIHTDYGKLAYDILRPEVSQNLLDHKVRYLATGALLGLTCGSLGYGLAYATTKLSIISPDSLIGRIYNTVLDHPVEFIGGFTALFVGIGAYKLAFHRPNDTQDLAIR